MTINTHRVPYFEEKCTNEYFDDVIISIVGVYIHFMLTLQISTGENNVKSNMFTRNLTTSIKLVKTIV